MLKAHPALPILAEAEKRETEYDWLGAAQSYKKTLSTVEQDIAKKGEIFERCGHASYRAAMQAETKDDFRDRILQAIEEYSKSSELHGRASELGETARSLRSQAMLSYLSFWLASEPGEKKKHLDESWRLTSEALAGLQKAGEPLEYGRTYNQLATIAYERILLDSNFDSVERTAREAVEEGERAIVSLSAIGDNRELATAYATTGAEVALLSSLSGETEARERYDLKTKDYWRTANETSEDAALFALTESGGHFGLTVDLKEYQAIYTKALECCRRSRDRLHTGRALDILAAATFWQSLDTEDPEEKVELAKRALQYAEGAEHQYFPLAYTSQHNATVWPACPYVEHYWQLASYETDLTKKRGLLRKANQAAKELMRRAENSGCLDNKTAAHHSISKVLTALAKLETNPEEKKRLLEEALDHRSASIREISPLQHFAFWSQGVYQNYLADVKSELARLTTDPEAKKGLLRDAAAAKAAGADLCLRDLQSWEKTAPMPGERSSLGRFRNEYGNLLTQLYQITRDRTNLSDAVRAFENAAESFQKAGLASSTAECYWRSGLTHYALDQHPEASRKFDLAADSYRKAAEKVPLLKGFYQDYASYMEAWSDIEKARLHHSREEYGLAKEWYEKAAALHRATKKWHYLTANYQAWSSIEEADYLSRREQNGAAISAFTHAIELFLSAKKSLQAELPKLEDQDEREMTTRLTKAADLRIDYCKARVLLEDAVVLDKQGDHYSSSERHHDAASAFERLVQTTESEQDRVELRLIMTLAMAWQTMTKAEAEESPSLYTKASEIFEEAKSLCQNEKTRSLILGHSRFCRALEAGARYADNRDPELQAKASQHLETASNYYVKAGFETASQYAKASKLLFDAYSFLDEANRERNHEKKARYYAMAEKVLQASAEAYAKADHPEKRDQAQKLLERAKEEKTLALSLTDVFQAPSVLTTSAAFTTPIATGESPVGLEKFEHADIQSTIIVHQKNIVVGEGLALEIDLVNTGKGAAQLIRLEELIPEGFELTEKPEHYRVQGNYLNMKGKQLPSLKTEELKLVLKPWVKGSFTIKPRVTYLDDSGKPRMNEPEPITVTVKELGISGWLKGQ